MEQKKHILLLDSVAANQECLSKYYRVSQAESGEQILRFLEEEEAPDLILLDIAAPKPDGYGIMEKIQQSPQWANIPVIFLTEDADTEGEIRGLQMGAKDCIHKPFDPELIYSRIENVFQTEETRKNLEYYAKKDSLTGTWNRRYLEECLAGDAETLKKGAFFLIDLDNFKAVNDFMGHLVGDAVLVKFAKCLQSFIRENDILCRIGGDEFVLFFAGITDREELTKIAEKINTEVVQEVNQEKGEGPDVSVSIGIAVKPDNGVNMRTLYNKSDKALYFIKENGKRGYHFYQEKDKLLYDIGVDSHGSAVDLGQLKQLIREREPRTGAYEVEYDSFKRIFQFVDRSVKRSKRYVQIVLFTLEEETGHETEDFETTMRDLERAIVDSLRRGDVAARYSTAQYVVILMDTDTQNGIMVAERIRKNWEQENKAKNDEFRLKFDIEQFDTVDEE